VWSPDGREIAFESVGTGRTVVVNAQGGEPQALSANVESSRVEWSPDGSWLLVQRRNQLMRLTRSDGTMAPLPHASTRRLPANVGRFSRDGRSVVYAERAGQWPRNFWRLSISDGSVSRVTELTGRRGDLGSFATHEEALYFTWREDEGDIWVMDVMTPISR
jgi:Tol biopolymer transport system component